MVTLVDIEVTPIFTLAPQHWLQHHFIAPMPTRPPSPQPFSWLSLRVPPLALFALFATAIWLLPDLLPIRLPGAGMAAAVLPALGGGFCLAGVLEFRHARTTVNPVNPAASTALVVRGVYRLTRNPMYLGFALLLLAFTAGLGNLSGLLAVMVFMAYLQHFQICPEEAALHARFGPAFERYCQQVRRWL